MRVVFLCRNGLVARYVAHELSRDRSLTAIVVESGRDARRRKLRRDWERTPWWRIPLFLVDLVALALYGRLWRAELRRRMAGHPALEGYPEGVPLHRVHDANDEECVGILRDLTPDVMVVLGTSILGRRVLEIPTQAALNIHGGIVPEYRNVHSEVWAVLRGEPTQVGTSIIHLDEGIDSGAVALQERVGAGTPDAVGSFFDLRWRNVELAARLARQALRRHSEGTLPRLVQDAREAGFHPTPGARELVRLLISRR